MSLGSRDLKMETYLLKSSVQFCQGHSADLLLLCHHDLLKVKHIMDEHNGHTEIL